jgi:hypothetical protein
VNGLHQWDYGQKLQINAAGLPPLIEVHFACPGMVEADVRLATVTDGTATVSIPDQCLEQAAPITAWVYLVDDASGRTALEITLNITPRTKPSAAGTAELEEEAGNKYDQLFGLMQEAYDAIEACKNVEANADEAQAAAEGAAASADASESSARAAATSASAAATSAAAANASAQAAQAYLESTRGRFFDCDNRWYVGTPTSARGVLLYCSDSAGQYYHAFLEHSGSGQIANFGLIYWDGVHIATSSPARDTVPVYLEIEPDPSENVEVTSKGEVKQYLAGRASFHVLDSGALIVNDDWTLCIQPLTGEHYTPE